MRTTRFLILAVSIALITAFTFSCSSDSGSTGGGTGFVSCSLTGGTCVDNLYTLPAQCTQAGGTPIAACINCDVAGVCMQFSDAATCTQYGGTVSSTCTSSVSDFVNCEVMGTCMPVATEQVCTASGGTVVASCPGGPGPGPGGISSSSSGGTGTGSWCVDHDYEDCILVSTLSKEGDNCADDFGGVTANSCPASYCNWETLANCEAPPTTPSSSSNTPSSSSGGSKPLLYCDYGLPNSGGGGCYPMDIAGGNIDCDTEYGKLATSCGRTDIPGFCVYATGKCYDSSQAACNTSYGDFYTECPVSTFEEIMYCLDGSNSGTCDRIGTLWTNAKQCITAGGAVVNRDFCLDIGVSIN